MGGLSAFDASHNVTKVEKFQFLDSISSPLLFFLPPLKPQSSQPESIFHESQMKSGSKEGKERGSIKHFATLFLLFFTKGNTHTQKKKEFRCSFGFYLKRKYVILKCKISSFFLSIEIKMTLIEDFSKIENLDDKLMSRLVFVILMSVNSIFIPITQISIEFYWEKLSDF